MLRITVLILLLLNVIACSGFDNDHELYIVEGAYNLKKILLKNDNATQYSYFIDAQYPNNSVKIELERVLLMQGFKSCNNYKGWENIVYKKSEDIYIDIKQNITYFYNKELKELILVSLRYSSDRTSDKINDHQQEVMIIIYKMASLESFRSVMVSISC